MNNYNNDEGKVPPSELRPLDIKFLLPHQELLLM